MDKKQYIVALEIGSSKIVGVLAERTDVGTATVLHMAEEQLVNCVRYGCVQNVENIKSSINRIIRSLESNIDGRVTKAYVGISGRSLHSEVSEVNRSLNASQPITDDVINHVINEAGQKPLRNYETICAVPRAFFVDKTETPNPVGQFGATIKIKVNLIVAKPSLNTNLTRVMNLGVDVPEYIVTPLAVANSVLTESERSLGCMLIDMGAETTTVSIYKDDTLAFLTTLPLGGRNITRDIMTGLNVLEETAERVKQHVQNPLDPAHVKEAQIEGIASSDAANYIAARVGEIIENIKVQFDYAAMPGEAVHSIVALGGGMQLHGMPAKLEEATGLPVRVATCPQAITLRDQQYNRLPYVEVFSLVAEAAKRLPIGDSCLERHTFTTDDFTFDTANDNTADDLNNLDNNDRTDRQGPPEHQDPKKRSITQRLTDILRRTFSEDENDDFNS